MLYSLVLFLHVVGALVFFIALALEWTSLSQLRQATTSDQLASWLPLAARLRWLYPAALVAILIPGFYMTAVAWTSAAWIPVALVALIILFALGGILSGRRMAGIGRDSVAERGPLSDAYRQRLRHPILWTSVQVRAAIAVGIVFLMTVKPDLAGSLVAIVVAAILGLASTWPTWSRRREEARAA